MSQRASRRYHSVVYIVLAFLIGIVTSSRAGNTVSVTMPTARSTVSGSAPIVIAISTAVSSVSVYIDGVYLTSGPPLIIDWNSKNGDGRPT